MLNELLWLIMHSSWLWDCLLQCWAGGRTCRRKGRVWEGRYKHISENPSRWEGAHLAAPQRSQGAFPGAVLCQLPTSGLRNHSCRSRRARFQQGTSPEQTGGASGALPASPPPPKRWLGLPSCSASCVCGFFPADGEQGEVCRRGWIGSKLCASPLAAAK